MLNNAMDYRRDGWTVVFRDGSVYLGRDTGFWWRALVRGGYWLGSTPVNNPVMWESVAIGALPFNPRLLAKACYCSSLPSGNCDFCGNTRRVPEVA